MIDLHHRRHGGRVWLVLLALLLGVAVPGGAQEPAANHLPTEADPLDRLIARLGSPRFAVRREAAAELADLLQDTQRAQRAAARLQQVLYRPETSFEVSRQIAAVLAEAGFTPQPPAADISPDELDRLVEQLQAEAFSARLAAQRRLRALLERPELVCPILTRLKDRLAARPEASTRLHLEPLYQRARQAWIASDPQRWNLPKVDAGRMEQWLDVLAADATAEEHVVAMRELGDLILRDEYLPAVHEGLKQRLAAADLTPQAEARLRRAFDRTRPMLVAEYWEGRRHVGIQYMIVGVPSFPEGGLRASHFDPVDEQRAHCVSGNSLQPGEDYPIGVAIPHPQSPGAMFHLVYLPTPLRRERYEQDVQRDEAQRLAELSRRTLDRVLADRRPLMEPGDLMVLSQLDDRAVSQFCGDYFQRVDDRAFELDGRFRPGGARTMHGALCVLLAQRGTHEAIPGLEKAVRAGRFLAPREGDQVHLGWIAALAIARREPWPEVDAWLGKLLAETEPLVPGTPHPPEVGASAAGLLLQRHGEEPAQFGLHAVQDARLNALGCPGYRFEAPQHREALRRWWEQKQAQLAPDAAQP